MCDAFLLSVLPWIQEQVAVGILTMVLFSKLSRSVGAANGSSSSSPLESCGVQGCCRSRPSHEVLAGTWRPPAAVAWNKALATHVNLDNVRIGVRALLKAGSKIDRPQAPFGQLVFRLSCERERKLGAAGRDGVSLGKLHLVWKGH